MNITIKINTENDAFAGDNYYRELHQVWFRAMESIQRYTGNSVVKNKPLYDSYGNKVGTVSKES